MSQLIEITLPADQLEGTSATFSRWLVEPGSAVKTGDPLLELETDKVSMEVSAPADGVLEVILVSPGDAVEAEMVLGRLAQTDVAAATANDTLAATGTEPAAAPRQPPQPAAEPDNARHLIGPAVRKLVRENDLDIDLITGTGRAGRVTRDDVLRFLATPAPAPEKLTRNPIPSRKVPHSTMRKTIAKHMVESLLHTSPHVTSVFEMDMSNIIEHRRWHRKEYAEEGVNLTFTAYFLAASVKAVNRVPHINARYHEEALELFEDINIGVGTALGEEGLVVPVVRQVQNKKLFDIARALQEQTEKARTGKLTRADMNHGTFTISNHGVSGSLFAAPIIINQPQVAILGIGKMEKRAVVAEIDGEDVIDIKPMCYVSLTIDHRAVDAFQTNRFLAEFVDTIENWGQ